jgi:hypothetical protein
MNGESRTLNCPPKRGRLTARKAGFGALEKEANIEPGEVTTVALEMTPGGEMTLRLQPAPSFPSLPEEVTVTLYDASGEARFLERSPTLPGGLVQVTGAPVGVWDLKVSDTSGLVAAEVRGVSLPWAEVTVQLAEMGMLRIVVPEMIEQGLVGRVELRDASGRAPLGFNGEGFRGQGEFRGIPVGEWVVRVLAGGLGSTWGAIANVLPGPVSTVVPN